MVPILFSADDRLIFPSVETESVVLLESYCCAVFIIAVSFLSYLLQVSCVLVLVALAAFPSV